MATAVFGRKKHMTQAFQDDGTLVSVTVIEVEPNFVTAVRTADEDGYDAVQRAVDHPGRLVDGAGRDPVAEEP